jgi:hypothetical protein
MEKALASRSSCRNQLNGAECAPMLERAIGLTRRILLSLYLAPSRQPPFVKRRYRFRESAKMRVALGPDLGSMTRWEVSNPTGSDSGELERVFYKTDNVHKWLHYLPIYEQAMAGLRGRAGRILEIGVARGGSLAMWRRYFGPATVIVGVDINPDCKQFEDVSKNVYVRIGSQRDTDLLRSVVTEFGPFDAIIDDGSHMSSHMVDTFRFLFANGLADGGVYIVEDIHCNYWTAYRDSSLSFVDFTKYLIDAMHAHYHGLPPHAEHQFRIGSELRRPSFDVPLATVLIDKVEFCDSIAVIRRANGRRVVPRTEYR